MLARKKTCQRVIVRLDHDSLSDPLPELRLRRPKLFHVAADDERGLLLPLFSFFLGGDGLYIRI